MVISQGIYPNIARMMVMRLVLDGQQRNNSIFLHALPENKHSSIYVTYLRYDSDLTRLVI